MENFAPPGLCIFFYKLRWFLLWGTVFFNTAPLLICFRRLFVFYLILGNSLHFWATLQILIDVLVCSFKFFKFIIFKDHGIVGGRAQQITQTVRVLRARSALLLPSPQLNLAPPTSQPLQIHPLILKSEVGVILMLNIFWFVSLFYLR